MLENVQEYIISISPSFVAKSCAHNQI